MSSMNAELRPAWRNYCQGVVVGGFLLLAALGFVISTVVIELESKTYLPWLGAGLCILLAFLQFLAIALKRFSWKFTIEENRVCRHSGLISRNQQSVRIKDLRSIELDQSLSQRILGIGDLVFYSAGSADAEVTFFGIISPSKWRDSIENAMDQVKDSNEE